ncbi:HSP90 family protein [Paenibacillus hunanensis]|uniref:Molecular chaperone HtpG n=1 Tax=Paenibacillus hunanensis TaxID=539262 RepID=A0ABU1IYZ1_9BACL|nr:HSP90 family protein [Paenibacillus hunanensis]MDR6244384.1 molecular chaperone HtpG [Paenibacillus hunanensis]GGI99110.1 molecular chaperone HtpG [Paenibacillus hunanensis]
MTNKDTYRFQVNLSGMINILSNHLYSNPRVFLREVMQNGVDAVTARTQIEPDHTGHIHIELTGDITNRTLIIEDNGIGLTEEDIHEFLAQIGQSSKRGEAAFTGETSFIGRFGIGLLSCFMVSDEIVMVTRSAKGGPTLEWRGQPDGTYSIRKLDTELSPGTKVYLRCKPGSEMYFDPEYLAEGLYYYGALLPYPITLQYGEQSKVINDQRPVWLHEPELARSHRDEVLDFGERLMGERFKDFIPLRTSSGRTGGIAFVLPHSVNLNAKRSHQVYLKSMLVSDKAENILPDWAFFVKCLIWTDELQPTASREHFYEDEKLQQVREELGDSIRSELMRMADYDSDRLQHIIQLHVLSMKALATEDEQFYRIIHRWLPFETTFGRRTLGEMLKEHDTIYFTLTLDEYRQITHVAAAQALLVVNGGYIYDAELMSALPLVNDAVSTNRLMPEDVSLSFVDLTPDERRAYYELTRTADTALQRFRCQIQLKRFKPSELPALFTLSKESSELRSLEAAKEVSTDTLSSILGSLGSAMEQSAYSTLYLNLDNPVVSKIFMPGNEAMMVVAVEMLYVNALMMGHYPMNRQELATLNQGILRFIELGLSAGGSGEAR